MTPWFWGATGFYSVSSVIYNLYEAIGKPGHLYDDDTELCFIVPTESGKALHILDQFLDVVVERMRNSKLKLIPGKMEVLWVRGSQVQELGSFLSLMGLNRTVD